MNLLTMYDIQQIIYVTDVQPATSTITDHTTDNDHINFIVVKDLHRWTCTVNTYGDHVYFFSPVSYIASRHVRFPACF
jgi:hypothetical protein